MYFPAQNNSTVSYCEHYQCHFEKKIASDAYLHSLTGNKNAANVYFCPYFTCQHDFRQIALKKVNQGSSTGLIQSNFFTSKQLVQPQLGTGL